MTSIGGRDLSGWFEDLPLPRAPRLGRGLRRTLLGVAKVAGLVALTGLGLALAIALVPARDASDGRPKIAADAWVEVNRPIEIFGLAGTDFARLPQTYRARRHPAGGRQDIVTFGEARVDAPFLALSFYRLGRAPEAAAPFADDIEDMARDTGLGAVRASAPSVLATRFGPFEAADIRLAEGGVQTPCLGFRNSPGASNTLRIAGLLCGGAGRPAARDSLRCVIDRIDLVSAGDDTALQRMFVDAERRRGSACSPSPLTAAGSRPTWLDVNASLPVLRGLSKDVAAKE
ncbi:MAG TPA: hypothetical protein VH414_19825 [Lichenihabitans sp.]|jgi:hypothetical protein|nr:hypothetical protein [Lichenihabitans sp.]